MVNNFAPRGTCLVGNLFFGTAGPTVTPSKDDEYSDPAGLTAQARLSRSGRRLGPSGNISATWAAGIAGYLCI